VTTFKGTESCKHVEIKWLYKYYGNELVLFLDVCCIINYDGLL
jgi:hypothetical protein